MLAPDSYRGCLPAPAVASALSVGLRDVDPSTVVDELPVADGGEGTVDAAVSAGLTRRAHRVSGPTGRPVTAAWALGDDGTAVVELAEASGLHRLPDGPAPLVATTRGTGQLVAAALDAGARRVVLAVGGSATTDGGTGLAAALGVALLDREGRALRPGGAALRDLDRVDVSGRDPRLDDVEVLVASDVTSPLLGPRGAAVVYGPQKGATADDVEVLEAGLRRLADVLRRDLGVDVADLPGAGAAGGAGAGAVALLGARVVDGVDVVLDLLGFDDAVARADLVVTGEGRLDEQSAAGKAPVGVARRARAAGVPVVAVAGRVDLPEERLVALGLRRAWSLVDLVDHEERAQREAARLLRRRGGDVARWWVEQQEPDDEVT